MTTWQPITCAQYEELAGEGITDDNGKPRLATTWTPGEYDPATHPSWPADFDAPGKCEHHLAVEGG